MKSIILVGGKGTRLRPLTYSVVKSMVPVVNRPFLEHVIRRLAQHGVEEIVLAMGYKPDSILEYFKNGSGAGVKLAYNLEEVPLGTAGAVKHADRYINGTFFVLNGDVFSDIDYTDMLNFHRRNNAIATIALTRVDDPTKFGVVETSKGDRVNRFIEKPRAEEVTSHWINAGVYILEPSVLGCIPKDTFYMFEQGVFPQLLEKREPVYAYKSDAYWIDMGTPSKYQQLNNDILQNKCFSPLFEPSPVSIYPDTSIHPSARLDPPVIIDRECIIDAEAALIGPTAVGKGCHIMKGSHIRSSILWKNVVVGEGALIANSVIADGVKIDNNARIDGLIINHEAPADTGGE